MLTRRRQWNTHPRLLGSETRITTGDRRFCTPCKKILTAPEAAGSGGYAPRISGGWGVPYRMTMPRHRPGWSVTGRGVVPGGGHRTQVGLSPLA